MRSTYFTYSGEFYEYREGTAMGSPVFAVVANLYMEFFRARSWLLSWQPLGPVFESVMWMTHAAPIKTSDVDWFLDHLNSL